ncbi:MAG: Gfo/Idh/MocA family oxidoreductase [Ktedonobacteraceae bacterium]|nr:Gfo/Idh/MocA family oxidoreductase [Ktedonobacteraceae bacterium]
MFKGFLLLLPYLEEYILDTTSKVNVGIVGTGTISSIYLQAPQKFAILNTVACADIDMERARAQAAKYHVPKACTVEELLADPDIDVVVNLTIPQVHAEISLAAIEAGKSVYSEKPLAINREAGRAILEAARQKNLRVGCAPDTFMGAGLQTCIKLINDGAIGQPVAATAFMPSHGPESWHPNPEFFYQPGSGPMLDMGPYYLTALISMIGPMRRVAGMARISFPQRTITSRPKYGSQITVNTPTHVSGLLEFAGGAQAMILTSFDVWANHLPRIEVYGSEGTLSVPDPNTFDGPVYLWQQSTGEWREIPLIHEYSQNSRGLGIADMAYAMRAGHAHRASGEMALHVLDIMQSFLESSEQSRFIELTTTCERPAPFSGKEVWDR